MCDAKSAFFSALVRNLEVVVVVVMVVDMAEVGAVCCCCFLGSGGLSDGMRLRRKETLRDFGRGGGGAFFLIPRTSSRLVTLLERETWNIQLKQ